MSTVHIATSRPVGHACLQWAAKNLPPEWEYETDPDRCDVFISVMYAHLVSEQFIEKRRCYNFHPGILPQYRGSGAFSWAILNGEKTCGITLHELDVNIDSGPIIEVKKFPIEGWDTAGTLFHKGMKEMERMFREWFVRLLAGDYHSTPQDASLARTYYRKDLRAAMDLTRQVRAFTFDGKEPAFYTDRNGQRHDLTW